MCLRPSCRKRRPRRLRYWQGCKIVINYSFARLGLELGWGGGIIYTVIMRIKMAFSRLNLPYTLQNHNNIAPSETLKLTNCWDRKQPCTAARRSNNKIVHLLTFYPSFQVCFVWKPGHEVKYVQYTESPETWLLNCSDAMIFVYWCISKTYQALKRPFVDFLTLKLMCINITIHQFI